MDSTISVEVKFKVLIELFVWINSYYGMDVAHCHSDSLQTFAHVERVGSLKWTCVMYRNYEKCQFLKLINCCISET